MKTDRFFFRFLAFYFFCVASVFATCDSSLEGSYSLKCNSFVLDEGGFSSACCVYDESVFDIFDSFRDGESDKNISTKIISTSFDLNVTKDDFNGTVCLEIKTDTTSSDWIKEEVNESKIITIDGSYVSFISKDAYIFLKYKNNTAKDDVDCSKTLDGNATSKDDFAIRPKEFFVDFGASKVKAGVDFDVAFVAGIDKDTPSKDYNETNDGNSASFDVNISEVKDGCIDGSFDPDITQDITFKDGSKEIKDVSYNEVGDINITIKEKGECSKRYASVDCDDKEISGVWSIDENLSIISKTLMLRVTPEHFNVDITSYNFKSSGFTYISKDLAMSSFADVNITAQNKDGGTTKNYNKDCYANDIGVDFNYTTLDTKLDKFIYLYALNDNNSSQKDKDINDEVSDILDKSYFSTDHNGSAIFKIFYNFNRDKSTPVDPFKVDIENFSVTDSADSDVKGSGNDSGDALFYYGRIRSNDIKTSSNDIKRKVNIEVYDATGTSYTNGFKQVSLKWYINKKHTDKDMGYIYDLDDTKHTTLSEDSDANVTISSFDSGRFELNLKTDASSNSIYYIHINIDKYLWYIYKGFGEDYSYEQDSSCIEHPCFLYKYEKPTDEVISSGDYSGGDIDVKSRGEHTKEGVKVFR